MQTSKPLNVVRASNVYPVRLRFGRQSALQAVDSLVPEFNAKGLT